MSEDFVVGSVMTLVFGVLGGLCMRKVFAAFSREAEREQKEVFGRRCSAPQEFLGQMAVSCDPVLADWARRVAARCEAIPIGELNGWEDAFMTTQPLETTPGGYPIKWGIELHHNHGVALDCFAPYAKYWFFFRFSIDGLGIGVCVKPGDLSGEPCFPQMEEIHAIFKGWEKMS